MLDTLSAELILYIFQFLDLPDLELIARVEHDLFCLSRPTIGELVHRGIMRGLSIERRWRAGNYFYSALSVRQYEVSVALGRLHAGHIVSQHLTRRSAAPSGNHLKQLYPDVSHNVAGSLLPIVRKLKWSLRRDTLAKMVRDKSGILSVNKWLEGKPHLLQEGERVRLAICPDVRKMVGIFEKLSLK
ncbi:hypothetical protein C8F01DRAFT_1107491 [Mycena amicta]|nr:hypothetical protein C8F01DRAFT_1107491 [Mycena amicta]